MLTTVLVKDQVCHRNPVKLRSKFNVLVLDFLLLLALDTGQSKNDPVLNCNDLRLKAPSLVSGVYWIDPDSGSHSNAFQTYCDQETDSGGWTLVWSYTFTDYSSFSSGANAVTPRPSWSASEANTPVSTTVPLSETDYEAMNFSLWRTIGNEFLIKSNINNWIACKEGEGSLVQFRVGSVTCKLVKNVNPCAEVVPQTFRPFGSHGPYLISSNLYYYFDSSTVFSWPAHDPCGEGKTNQLKGVANPHGKLSRFAEGPNYPMLADEGYEKTLST